MIEYAKTLIREIRPKEDEIPVMFIAFIGHENDKWKVIGTAIPEESDLSNFVDSVRQETTNRTDCLGTLLISKSWLLKPEYTIDDIDKQNFTTPEGDDRFDPVFTCQLEYGGDPITWGIPRSGEFDFDECILEGFGLPKFFARKLS